MPVYPFTALVGMDVLRLALILNAINPAIGGVLIRGEKGTAKSTAVRGLAGVLPPIEVVKGDPYNYAPGHPDAPDGEVITRPVAIVELPVGATNDRVTGSLDLEQALTTGHTAFEPGLLADAHRGILYVDEVNLLGDHLVDLLLDSAAMGVNRVEREGVSITHPAQFQLIGTMNPEEGELRPQLLDRFGLSVTIAASKDEKARSKVVKRRLAYDADPVAFSQPWAQAQEDLAQRIVHAQRLLSHVHVSRRMLDAIVSVCAQFDVDGLRGDLVTTKTAATVAAWEGRDRVRLMDIKIAALLALGHRRRRGPFEEPGIDPAYLDAILSQCEDDPDDWTPDQDGPDPQGPDADDHLTLSGDDIFPKADPSASDDVEGTDSTSQPEEATPLDSADDADDADASDDGTDDADGADDADDAADACDDGPDMGAPNPDDQGYELDLTEDDASHSEPEMEFSEQLWQSILEEAARQEAAHGTEDAPHQQVAGIGDMMLPLAILLHGKGVGSYGRRSPALTDRGVSVGHTQADRRPSHLALVPTLRAMALRTAGQAPAPEVSEEALASLIIPQDWQESVLQGREGNLVLFVVDASGSMAARQRMDQVKGVILSLLTDAYQRRDRIGLIVFRGSGAQVAMRPTNSIDLAVERLRNLPTGGRTPLGAGLNLAAQVIRAERIRDERRRPLIVLITDGKATYPKQGAVRYAHHAAQGLAGMGVPTLVVDSEQGHITLGLAKDIATTIQGAYLPLEHLSHGLVQSLILGPHGANRMVGARG